MMMTKPGARTMTTSNNHQPCVNQNIRFRNRQESGDFLAAASLPKPHQRTLLTFSWRETSQKKTLRKGVSLRYPSTHANRALLAAGVCSTTKTSKCYNNSTSTANS